MIVSGTVTRGKEIGFTQDSGASSYFTYSISAKVISITDLKWGKRPAAELLEDALRKIEHWHQGSVTSYVIHYRDAEGLWGAVRWDGQHAEPVEILDAPRRSR